MPAPRPLVLIGAGRSGTRLLRDLLACHPEVTALPFDLNHVWRLGDEQHPDDVLPQPRDETHAARIRAVLQRLAAPGKAQVLVEKTVSNGLRIPRVQAVFPDAVFVHLVRDGRAVVESAQRSWQTPTETGYLLKKLRYFPRECWPYAAAWGFRQLGARLRGDARLRQWGPRTPWLAEHPEAALLEQCAWQWRECVLGAVSGFEEIGATPVEVRYEDLAKGPAPLHAVLDAAGLDTHASVDTAWQERVRGDLNDGWQKAWTDAECTTVERIIEPAQRALGYVDPPPERALP